MEGGKNGEEKKRLSFGFSVADENIKLIDILTENDDFLVDSPLCYSIQDTFSVKTDSTREHAGFRISGFGNSLELEILQQKDHNQLPTDLVKLQRPSFYRKSLAWDSAFFNSPGVLDPDELSCINEGFRKTEAKDVRKRRSESESRTNGDGFCEDWFEIEPSIYKTKSRKMSNMANRKQEDLQNVGALKKVDRSFRNKMKSNQTSNGKSINKMESSAKKRQGTISSPKPPMDLSGKSNGKMENISTITSSGQFLFTNASNAQSPRLLKRKTESGKNQLRASLSASSKIRRHGERNKGMGNKLISLSTSRLSSESLSTSVAKNKQGSDLDIKKRFIGPFVHTDDNEVSHLQSPLNSPKICSVGSLSANYFRPSELRPPSPQIGFFDENTSPRYRNITRNREMPQKVSSEASSCSNTQFAYSNNELSPVSSRFSSAYKKLKSPYSEVAKNIKRPETTDQENRKKKHISCSDQIDQLGNLSRYFAAIDLNRKKITDIRKRAPLADKTSSSNFDRTFAA